MKKNSIKKKLIIYHSLVRNDKPIGALLLLWPTLWALWIAESGFPSLWILIIFVLGVWLTRSAGCIFNDYVDCKLDAFVKRTINRPITKGLITKKEAIILFVILIFLSFLLVSTLNFTTIFLSFFALILILIYPFMKRYIYFPQVILGIAYSWSILMVFSSLNKITSLSCWLMFLSNILWVVAYDTQYAMIDKNDDLKIGVKSTAILFDQKDNLIIGTLQIFVLVLMTIIGLINRLNWIFYFSILIAGICFLHQGRLIFNRNSSNCFLAFKNNNYVGLVLFLGFMIGCF